MHHTKETALYATQKKWWGKDPSLVNQLVNRVSLRPGHSCRNSRWSGIMLQWVLFWRVKIYRIGCLTLLPRSHHPLLSRIFPEDISCRRTRSANQPSVKLYEPGEDSCTSDTVTGISPSSPHWHVLERLYSSSSLSTQWPENQYNNTLWYQTRK